MKEIEHLEEKWAGCSIVTLREQPARFVGYLFLADTVTPYVRPSGYGKSNVIMNE